MHSNPRDGCVILVGGGPGDPQLITVGGLQAVREADVVVHDRLAPLECLTEARPDAEIIDVGKVPRGPATGQEEINRLLVDRATKGLRVVRLKGGDSFVMGRGGEEWQACMAAGVAVHVIPGVTSAVAVPALSGIPVTHRWVAQGFTVVSGHVPPDDPRSNVNWDGVACCGTTIVILMGMRYLSAICARLTAAGLPEDTPAVVVADGCSPGKTLLHASVSDLASRAAAAGLGPPAVVVIGPVARPGFLSGP